MMFSSSSTTVSQHRYDVFMSFRGEDTRTGFTSHLYKDLTQNGITAYKDDKRFEIGRPIAPELLQTIETSRFAVVVLSVSFATSKWCLEEIAKIAECMKQGKLIVIPVFYHVFPTDVRHQINCFEQGFADHEDNPEIAPQKVETWRAAFKEVAEVSGVHVTQHKVEAEVISEIVSKILKGMPDTPPIDLPNSLVGIDSRVDEVKRMLRMDSSEVLFIGICGMSGIGKTTIVESIYKNLKNRFEKSSLIENIKDISKQNDSADLCKLQQKLLDDILMEKSIRVQNVIHGQTLLGTKLRSLKVIIVLDDVNHVDQLTYLAGGLEWYGHGSRIIITTTNKDLLNLHKINEIYMCVEMKGDEALSLFCQSAFEQTHPTHGYEKLSDDIVNLAGGLPLALNVYGKLLCRKNVNYWKEMMMQLKEYPEKEVLGRLEVVYARLDKNQRYVFIYIACFLKGRNKDLVKDILNNIGLQSECGITDLMNKCLITINHEDNVWMHDLLQQMCWKVLHTETHRYDVMHIAIKSLEDKFSLNTQGAQNVEVINQDPYKGEVNDRSIDISKMRKLKFLRIGNLQLRKGLKYLSSDLRILEWYGCSLKSLPSMFEPKHVYELEMCCSQLKTLWKKDVEMPNLRSINLSFSKYLTKIPDMSSASNLVKLNLEGCTNLTRLHASVPLQKRLRYLNLIGCTRLESLGGSRMEMEDLEALLLSGCSKLKYIPEFGKNMKRLAHLYVDGTRIKKLPENLGQMYDLRNLDANGTFIEEIPSSIYGLKKLRLLHINRCQLSFKTGCFLNPCMNTLSSGLKEVDLSYCNLSVVPDGIGLLCHLITLDLSGNEFVSLPASIGLLSKLRVLFLNDCKKLRLLPKLSLVDEDMDYGPRSRFSYYVSTEGVDVSEFHASSLINNPTVSCLNCPKLAVDKRGSYLAEKILNSYLELRMKHWMTPEAIFEIVCAGSEIPSGFVQPGSEGLILEGPWIGVAICAVISVHNLDVYKESKYTVIAHIHLGEKHVKIPAPVNFIVSEAETQLIFYWTEADDLRRIVVSSQKSNFGVSFSVEPDTNVQVTKFGVRFIHEEYMLHLKRHEDSVISLEKPMIHFNQLWQLESIGLRIAACKGLDYHICKIVDFVSDYGRQKGSLDDIYQITKGLLEYREEYISAGKSVFKPKQFISCYREVGIGASTSFNHYRGAIFCCFVMSVGASVLYNDFVRLVKDINDGWWSVMLALEQIVIRSRAGNYEYNEMLQQLNDLEAAKSVGLSDKFIKMLESIIWKTFDLFNYLVKVLCAQRMFSSENSYSSMPEGKVFTFITSVLCILAAYMGDFELLEAMKQKSLNSLVLHLFQAFADKKRMQDGWFIIKTSQNCELQISDFVDNQNLIQELMNKMGRSRCFTKDNEKEMVSIIHRLQNNVQKVSHTIQDMSSHAHQYTRDLQKAKKHVKSFSRLSKDDFHKLISAYLEARSNSAFVNMIA